MFRRRAASLPPFIAFISHIQASSAPVPTALHGLITIIIYTRARAFFSADAGRRSQVGFPAVFRPLPPYSLIFAVSPFDFVSLAVGFAFCAVFMRRKGDLRDFYTVAAHPIFRSYISARFRRDPHSFPLSVCRKYPLSAPEHVRKRFPA